MVEQSHLFHLVAFADVLAQPLVATAPFPVPSLGAVAFALAHEIRMGVNVIFAPSDVDPCVVHECVVQWRSPWRRHFHTIEIVGFPFERCGLRDCRRPVARQTPATPIGSSQLPVALDGVLQPSCELQMGSQTLLCQSGAPA